MTNFRTFFYTDTACCSSIDDSKLHNLFEVPLKPSDKTLKAVDTDIGVWKAFFGIRNSTTFKLINDKVCNVKVSMTERMTPYILESERVDMMNNAITLVKRLDSSGLKRSMI